ncbi:MAG TPA: AMP-binding protein [Chloroflexota bacterium]
MPFSEWAAFCASGSATEGLPDVRPDDAAQIQYTSGTTGFPKGAVLHHRGVTNNARFWAQRQSINAGDVLVNVMPASCTFA